MENRCCKCVNASKDFFGGICPAPTANQVDFCAQTFGFDNGMACLGFKTFFYHPFQKIVRAKCHGYLALCHRIEAESCSGTHHNLKLCAPWLKVQYDHASTCECGNNNGLTNLVSKRLHYRLGKADYIVVVH